MASFNDLSYAWLDDFDWSLRMVMSSDKLSDLHKPLLMLTLETTNINGEKANQLIELTTQELKYLIEKLKTVQKVILLIVKILFNQFCNLASLLRCLRLSMACGSKCGYTLQSLEGQ